jgi:hypothetical protein
VATAKLLLDHRSYHALAASARRSFTADACAEQRPRWFEHESFLSLETALVGQRSNPSQWWKLGQLLDRL